ncbi:LAMI_0A04698g1_1 [Lachancea mirantina]|uniref:LAMI_0A04698g1_1 n=1 Tax=Lachancea mirantina TaxID=1230905 RepID=A0A1G4IP46_9SACH|nr:LAMI_0A04698g1_1 [Lachancea mirantina]
MTVKGSEFSEEGYEIFDEQQIATYPSDGEIAPDSEDCPAGKRRKKRSSLACVRCRRRHVKCPGGNPCSKCVAAGIACEYMEPNKKLIVSMKYLQKLQSNLAEMKKENVKLQSLVSTLSSKSDATNSTGTKMDSDTEKSEQAVSNTRSAKSDFPQADDEEIVPNFTDRRGRLVESRTGQKYFVGSSSMTLFGMEIQSLIPKSVSQAGNENQFLTHSGSDNTTTAVSIDEILQEEGNAYRIVLAKTDTNNNATVNLALPSYSYAILLVDTFITYNDGCFYFFNEGLIKEQLKTIYNGGAEFRDHTLQTIWFCKLLLIFATGEMYLGTANKRNGNKLSSRESAKLPGSGFFEEASSIFSCLFSSGRIENVTKNGGIEVMLLYAFYLQVADCTVASYFYFGQALRTCLISGWHVDAERDSLSRFELEHRRRLWWTVYMFERMLSSKAGLPLSFADDTITTELPSDFDMSSPPLGCEYYIFPEAEYITNCVRITKINAQILNKLYQRQPSSNILPVLKDIVMQLLGWRGSLSDFLQVNFTQEELKISRLTTNMFTEYFQGMNLAIRPLLFHFASIRIRKWEKSENSYVRLERYSKTISSLLNCSLQASINTVRAFWYLKEQNMVALFGYMDREYLFTSACTLVLFNAAFGIQEQTKQHLDHALSIFTKMRNLGNNPAGLRRAQLLRLMSNLNHLSDMKDLIEKHADDLRPDAEFDDHNDKEVDIVSYASTTSSSVPEHVLSVSAAKANGVSSKSTSFEHTSNAFEPMTLETTSDIQTFLDGLDNLGRTESQLWKDISDQAMWLGNTMDPAGAVGEENGIGEINFSNEKRKAQP